ncbi:MAG: sugar kinase [Bacillota bacterium]|nr:sugar kinase [Bacillota bacterium]
MPELVTIGEAMLILGATEIGLLRHNELFRRAMGGAEANVAIGVSRLGHTAGWQSRLGDDEPGRYILSALKGEGVDTGHVLLDSAGFTALYLKERSATGDPRVSYYRKGSAASRMAPGDLDDTYIKSARVLHVTGITPALSGSCRDTVFAAVKTAKAAGVTVSFDPNMRYKLWDAAQARPVLLELARQADIVFPGLSEGAMMLGLDDASAIAMGFLSLGPKLVAVKMGADGAVVASASGICQVPAMRVDTVDTVGAGDAFAAAFIASYLDGREPGESCRRACIAGALATRVFGDWEGMPFRPELDALAEGGSTLSR